MYSYISFLQIHSRPPYILSKFVRNAVFAACSSRHSLPLLSSSETRGCKGLTAEMRCFQGRPPPTGHRPLSASKWVLQFKDASWIMSLHTLAFHSNGSHDGLKKPWFMCKNSLHPVLTQAVGLRPLSLLSHFSVFHPFCSGRSYLHSPPLSSV